MEEMADAAQEAVLGKEAASRLPTKEGVDDSVVVQKEVKGEVVAEGSE
jgi:hypothetical protein